MECQNVIVVFAFEASVPVLSVEALELASALASVPAVVSAAEDAAEEDELEAPVEPDPHALSTIAAAIVPAMTPVNFFFMFFSSPFCRVTLRHELNILRADLPVAGIQQNTACR
jgi:hypothetical protein